jgi:hypothetical protein
VDWKQELFNKALVVMQDPRVAKLVQDPRVMNGILTAMRLRTDVQRGLQERARQVVKALHLASEDEVRELQRAVSRLEHELERARSQRREAPDGRSFS